MDFVVFNGCQALTFRQLDSMNNVPKGTAFRRFKALGGQLQEGQDYFYLSPQAHGPLIASLQDQGLAYPGTPHLVLITRVGYGRMAEASVAQLPVLGKGWF